MATAIGCDLCETELAVMMQTNMANGDTISVGQACLLIFAGSSFAALLGNTDAATRAMYGQSLTDLIERIVGQADMLAYFGGAALPAGDHGPHAELPDSTTGHETPDEVISTEEMLRRTGGQD